LPGLFAVQATVLIYHRIEFVNFYLRHRTLTRYRLDRREYIQAASPELECQRTPGMPGGGHYAGQNQDISLPCCGL
jgi:hypothetical protein